MHYALLAATTATSTAQMTTLQKLSVKPMESLYNFIAA
jgi:hypothetical protein